jgi:hypothetical protein
LHETDDDIRDDEFPFTVHHLLKPQKHPAENEVLGQHCLFSPHRRGCWRAAVNLCAAAGRESVRRMINGSRLLR